MQYAKNGICCTFAVLPISCCTLQERSIDLFSKRCLNSLTNCPMLPSSLPLTLQHRYPSWSQCSWSHYRLNYLYVRFILAETCTKRVPQMMTGKVRNDYRLPVLVPVVLNIPVKVSFLTSTSYSRSSIVSHDASTRLS